MPKRKSELLHEIYNDIKQKSAPNSWVKFLSKYGEHDDHIIVELSIEMCFGTTKCSITLHESFKFEKEIFDLFVAHNPYLNIGEKTNIFIQWNQFTIDVITNEDKVRDATDFVHEHEFIEIFVLPCKEKNKDFLDIPVMKKFMARFQ